MVTMLIVYNTLEDLTIFDSLPIHSLAIVGLLPIIFILGSNGDANLVATKMAEQLQATNIIANSDNTTACTFLQDSVKTWLKIPPDPWRDVGKREDVYILALRLLPSRCDFQESDGLVTSLMCESICPSKAENDKNESSPENSCSDKETNQICQKFWNDTSANTSSKELARIAHVHLGSVWLVNRTEQAALLKGGNLTNEIFSVNVYYNQNRSIAHQ